MFRRQKSGVSVAKPHVKLILLTDDHSFTGDAGEEIEVEGFDVEMSGGLRLPRDDGEYVLPGVCHFKIAGVTHHGVAALRLAPLKEVELVPDPANEYDPNAIQIRVEGKHVGFVPKALAAVIRPDLPRDSVSGVVTRVYRSKGETIAAEMIVGTTSVIEADVTV